MSAALAVPAGLTGTKAGPAPAGRAASAARAVTAAYSDKTKCFGIVPFHGAAYGKGCYGHDEPAIDPISNVPGSGQDVTWTLRLPSSSAQRSLLDMGPTFWIGATLNDPSSLASRVFSELQFYPDSQLTPQSGTDINTACTPLGFDVNPDPGTWSICDFSWGLYGNASTGFIEVPAYVSVVDQTSNPGQALFLHSGDRIRVHIFNSGDANNDAEQVITDLTTGQSGSLIMDSNATTGAGSGANPGVGDGPTDGRLVLLPAGGPDHHVDPAPREHRDVLGHRIRRGEVYRDLDALPPLRSRSIESRRIVRVQEAGDLVTKLAREALDHPSHLSVTDQ